MPAFFEVRREKDVDHFQSQCGFEHPSGKTEDIRVIVLTRESGVFFRAAACGPDAVNFICRDRFSDSTSAKDDAGNPLLQNDRARASDDRRIVDGFLGERAFIDDIDLLPDQMGFDRFLQSEAGMIGGEDNADFFHTEIIALEGRNRKNWNGWQKND